MIELSVDGRIVAGYRSPNVGAFFEGGSWTWGNWKDFFFKGWISDADFDTGYHLSELTVTDSLGNQNTARCRFRLTRSMPGSYWSAESIRVSAGWNIVSPGIRAAYASRMSSAPPGIIASRFYEFKGTYVAAETLTVKKGYWVKSVSDGLIIFDVHADSLSLPAPRIAAQARSTNPPPPPSLQR